MSKIIRLTASDGNQVEFIDEIKAQGGMKDVYFSPDKKYVIALLRTPADQETRERLEMICTSYREGIFNNNGGEYLKKLYYWPTAVVEHDGRLGVVVPFYRDNFFFQYGSKNDDTMLGIKGCEKEGKWFSSAHNRQRFLDERELGTWLTHLQICILLARAVRRMHMAGLSHSDLGYKNCLVDPTTGEACLIDIDGLVVPGKHPPQVEGTPDFIAPEVIATSHLPYEKRILPSRRTDLHALPVLIYMYLLYRHPLRGGRSLHSDPMTDEKLNMGEQALFIEHPKDTSNRVKPHQLRESEHPWGDPSKIPYTVTGPYLSKLFEQAFITGLHNPAARPGADEWEDALVKTWDLVQPCHNPDCAQKWYVFDNTKQPKCPFCGTRYDKKLPVLNLYSLYHDGKYRPDNHRLMVYSGQSLCKWHISKNYYPNENLAPEDKKRVGYFQYHNDQWYLVNEGAPNMRDARNGQQITIGSHVLLEEGTQILLSNETGGRLISVQMAGV